MCPSTHHQRTNDVLAGHLNAVHAAIVELVADALADETWGGGGVRSPQQWLTWQLALTTQETDRLLALAKARVTHPVVSAQFAAGQLSVTQAAIASSVDPTRDAEIAEYTQRCTIHQLRMHTRAMRLSDDDAGDGAARQLG